MQRSSWCGWSKKKEKTKGKSEERIRERNRKGNSSNSERGRRKTVTRWERKKLESKKVIKNKWPCLAEY